MDNFENDPRRIQELKMRPIADAIYKERWGANIQITRFEQDDDYLLDKEYAIDVIIKLKTGMILTGQEKFLSYEYSDFGSLTVEYEQNQHTGEEGDWFKLQVGFYFVGYATEDCSNFEPWVLADWVRIVEATNNKKLGWITNKNKDGHAQASFRYTFMKMLPDDCILACSWKEDK